MNSTIVGCNIERDLHLSLHGVRPGKGVWGRLTMTWAVLRGREVGPSVVITDCIIGRKIDISREERVAEA